MEEKQRRLLHKLKSELGNTILEALDDPSIIEIMLNPDGKVWVERHGFPMEVITEMTAINAESLLGTIADALKTTITTENPILEGELPLDGSRFEGLLPPVVRSPAFTIRKKSSRIFKLSHYVEQGVMSAQQKAVLVNAVSQHKNILVCGGTGSGKTTLTNALIHEISDQYPDERLVIIEDTAEIQCQQKNNITMHTTINVDMLALLRATMRLRPDRILVGETRGKEAIALLKAWNTGHPGGITTIHANSALAGLIRLEQLIGESAESVSMAMQPLIAEAVNIVVMIEKTPDNRRIREIIAVEGIGDGSYLTTNL